MAKKEDVVFDVETTETPVEPTQPKMTKVTTSKSGNIFTTINNIMQDLPAIGKDSKNTQQNFWFRGIDAVMNALNPLFTKHGLFVVPNVLEQTREERQTKSGGLLIYSVVTVEYTFYTLDGSYIKATIIGEGMDSGDKSTNKALSIAFKYACFQVFCIPTEEMVDPDGDSPKPDTKKKTETSNNTKSNTTTVTQSATTGGEVTDEVATLRADIIKLAKSMGGNANESVAEATTRNIGGNNPNKCDDVEKLKALKSDLENLSKQGGK